MIYTLYLGLLVALQHTPGSQVGLAFKPEINTKGPTHDNNLWQSFTWKE